MKKLITILLALAISIISQAQIWPNPEVESAYNNAKNQLSNGKFNEAILLYNQVIAAMPESILANSGMARALLLKGNSKQALEQVNPFIKNGTADDQMYQIAAAATAKEGKVKSAGKIFEKGLDQYPSSGYLYYEYGKYLISVKDGEAALKNWVNGINRDPEFAANYYEAAYAYDFTSENIWSILYSEIMLNKESLTPRANDTRKIMLHAYKSFYTQYAAEKLIPEGSATNFYDAVKEGLLRFGGLITDNYSVENLTMLRIRFAMFWKQHYAEKFPYTLFQRHQEMITLGLFDTYNQFLLGQTIDKNSYDAWNKMHPKEMKQLKEWMSKHPLYMIPSDGYNPAIMKGIFAKPKTN